jgi:hypothetical protein
MDLLDSEEGNFKYGGESSQQVKYGSDPTSEATILLVEWTVVTSLLMPSWVEHGFGLQKFSSQGRGFQTSPKKAAGVDP